MDTVSCEPVNSPEMRGAWGQTGRGVSLIKMNISCPGTLLHCIPKSVPITTVKLSELDQTAVQVLKLGKDILTSLDLGRLLVYDV
jgi:hypothetical protein